MPGSLVPMPLPHPGPRLGTREPARDPLVQLVQPGRDNIHHHALNDASPDQLSAVAVLGGRAPGLTAPGMLVLGSANCADHGPLRCSVQVWSTETQKPRNRAMTGLAAAWPA